MKRACSFLGVLVVLGASVLAGRVAAQGITSGAVEGRVTADAGEPVDNATLALLNTSTGQRYSVRTTADGRYLFENVQVGGPYTLDVRALGFEPRSASGLRLVLGQRLVQDFVLRRAAVEVAGVTVTAEADPRINKSRTGAQGFVSEEAIRSQPTLNRNFIDFISAVPQVIGTSVSGQNNRFNNIQIDGGVNNDVFGLSGSGTPGGQANAHPITVEAVKEYQVLIAPYDVRQAGFTGGLINAVTKSGSNQFHGSVFGYLQGEALVGKDTAGAEPTEFNQTQYGLTLSGPIIRDRLHFFVATEFQSRARPFGGQQIGSDTTGGADSVGVGIRLATAERVQQIMQTNPAYGFDPGGPERPTLENPDGNVFAKLSGQLAENSQVELTYNHVDATGDQLTRSSTATGFRDGYQLSQSGWEQRNTTNTARGKWTALFGRFNNELILGYSTIRDDRGWANDVPLIFVGGDRAGTSIAAGIDRFTPNNYLDQDIIELTDNVTFSRGAHLLTVGTHNEFFKFKNSFFPASQGVWSFADTTQLNAVNPNRYEINLPQRPGGPLGEFDVKQIGFYLQDRWSPTPQLTLTAGLRVDVPSVDQPLRNPALDSILGINTADFPSGNALWSPRLGFNYDLGGDGETFLRGGVGIFSGRPPYVWVSNAFVNTGLDQATLICDGPLSGVSTDSVPTFTVGVQPTACRGGAGASTPIPSVVYFDSDFKFPQNLKLALGLDHRLPGDVVGTFDFVYTKWVNQLYITDDNLQGIVGTSVGEAGRPLYGALSATGTSSTPARRSGSFLDVLRHRNESDDRSFSVTAQLQKAFNRRLSFNVGYTYSHTEDLFSLTSSIAFSNYRFTALDGTIENRKLRTSVFDIPHSVKISGTFVAPGDLELTLVYTGNSGRPYTYMVSTDANGDGITGNDAVYVPRNAGDISLVTPADWAALDAFIGSESCLKEHRGALLSRNSCRNPWVAFLDARLAKSLRTVGEQSVEIIMDVINVPNLLNDSWGLVRQTTGFEEVNMLRRQGYDAVNQRGRYTLALPARNQVQVNASRWKIQLAVRYNF